MKNIMLIYKPNHASHRLINGTISQYNNNSYDCQDNIKIFPYCIDKKGELRLDRFIEKNKIDDIYVHQEFSTIIEELKSKGFKYLVYNRSDFVEKVDGWRSGRSEYNNLLLKELIFSEKLKSGKISLYIYINDKLNIKEVFNCDVKKYNNWSKTETEAKKVYIAQLEKKVKEEKDWLKNNIIYTEKRIKDMEKKIIELKKK